MSCLETYASLRIFSKSMHPDRVSHILGIQASDPVPMQPGSKYRTRREYHYWDWSSSETVKSTDGLEHVRAIVALLKGKEAQLQQLRDAGCDIDVCCYWLSSGQGGPFLDVPTLAALAHYGLEIWWDVMFMDGEEYTSDVSANNSAGGT
jgi:hypothetical protein